MDRRTFIKGSGAAFIALLLGGCGLGTKEQSASSAAANGAVTPDKGGISLKITLLTGSPHRNGTSALLADRFSEGAKSAGHELFRFDAAFEATHPCLGCNRCNRNGPCIHRDAIDQKLMPQLLAADLVAFVTPLYYFGMSSQLKTVVDRFYSHHTQLTGSRKKAVLLATAGSDTDWTMTALTQHYQTIVKYLGWEDLGTVLATGCADRDRIERSAFPAQAQQLGQQI